MPDTLKSLREFDERDKALICSLAKNNMNVSEVSRELFMHRNTVVYNLERIKRETGLNPMSFFDLVKLVGNEDTDVVSVVRCKECKHWYRYESDVDVGSCAKHKDHTSRFEDDFCSYGKRRNGNETA